MRANVIPADKNSIFTAELTAAELVALAAADRISFANNVLVIAD